MNVDIENAIAVVDKVIKDARIVGLKKWDGYKVKVVILEEE